MRKRPGGVRTRRQAQLEEEDGDAEADVAVKKGDKLKIKREEVEDAGWDLSDSPLRL
jgi:hypothetical protein